MGQTNSRGAPDQPQRPRSRLRPMSWAPSLRPSPPDGDSVLETVQTPPPPSSSSRPVSQLFLNPLNILSTHQERSDAGPSGSDAALLRRRSRISRARSSISSLPTLFSRRASHRSGTGSEETTYASSSATSIPTSRSTLRHTTSTGYERRPSYSPRVRVPDLDINFDDLPNNANTDPSNLQPPQPSSARRDGRTSLLPFRPDSGIRSMTSQLRRRRSPLRREEDQAAMLSRLLSVAAAATAASLMGDDHQAVSEARNIAGDGEDGTFDSFLQALQNGRIASALRQSGGEGEDGGETAGASPAPLNFFRMFRFGSSNSRRNDNQAGSRGASRGNGSSEEADEEDDSRMIPIIIVGIRSINPGSGNESHENIPPFLDALSSLPTPLASPGDDTMDGTLRQPQARFSHRRRASMGGMNNLSSSYDSQRHWRSPDRPRPWSTMADSPSGPLPPPSTPASSGLSAVSSGATTPSNTASPPSPTVQSSAPSRRGSFVRRATGSSLEPTVEEPPPQQRTPRQRRLSESDFTRFGSGSSRRNGVVEPDHNPGEGSRSWIIYVLGGSYPENHPILTTPSLFTDSPTYEDMLLLSSLLGPAKPPVASEEDVAAAPGLYIIQERSGTLVAAAVDESETLVLPSDARCLVCLSDFAVLERTRRLVTCGHLFHRECIDQWLTTGRNSCPLCRSQGVEEKSPGPLQVTNPDPDPEHADNDEVLSETLA